MKKRLLCLFSLLTILASLEVVLRLSGFFPSVIDSEYLWAYERLRARYASKPVLALIGTSRIMADLDVDWMAKQLPQYEVVMLAIPSTDPMAVLIDLAQDPKFNGIILCETPEEGFLPSHWDQQRSYVETAHRRDNLLPIFISSSVRWLSARLSLFEAIRYQLHVANKYWLDGQSSKAKFISAKSDRTLEIDFHLLKDIKTYRDELLSKARLAPKELVSPDQWLSNVKQIEEKTHSFRERGGQLLFVNFPVSAETWEIKQREFPKQIYWDKIPLLSGIETFHFSDDAQMRSFDCPDTLHLDKTDKLNFTKIFLERIRGMKLL